jgi:hypothetical protein
MNLPLHRGSVVTASDRDISGEERFLQLSVPVLTTELEYNYEYTRPVAELCHYLVAGQNNNGWNVLTPGEQLSMLQHCSDSGLSKQTRAVFVNPLTNFFLDEWDVTNAADKAKCGIGAAYNLKLKQGILPVVKQAGGVAVFSSSSVITMHGAFCVTAEKTTCLQLNGDTEGYITGEGQDLVIRVPPLTKPTVPSTHNLLLLYEPDAAGNLIVKDTNSSNGLSLDNPPTELSKGEIRRQ